MSGAKSNNRSKSFTVATANTHMCEALSSPEAVRMLGGNDILLMQEVVGMDESDIASALGAIGLNGLVYHAGSGLAIAYSGRFRLLDSRYTQIQSASWAKNIRLLGDIRTRFRERGMLGATLHDNDTGNDFHAVTAHPIVCTRPISRTRQVRTISKVLLEDYGTGPIIFGQDCNHYPGPNTVDKQLALDNNLKYVSFDGPTCLLAETKWSFLRHLGLPDARLDSILTSGFIELSSEVKDIKSDHKALKAELIIK
jgi:endonuclease/exonuclease/phosphatase family metal-dependent hydrolase